ncbi:MAG: 4Fe-4S dicluster domain-containing protein [Chloroflexi bacterium]|nr:4Fe-4S dicluster domain-containing protein [Chloroflexota bacterium]
MADKPKVEEKKVEEKPQGISRRELLVDAGIGVAGLVVGGAVGYKVIPQPAVPPTPLPELWIGRNIANQSCMGCRLCETACSQIKEQVIRPSIARVTVPQYAPGVEFPILCYQCGDEAMCIQACPTQALSLDTSKKLNTIAIDKTKCLRTAKGGDCTLCADKCPGNAVTFHPTTKEPLICDLCGGDPACVKACYNNTITLKGVKMAAVKADDIAKALADLYKIPPPPKTANGGGMVAVERNDDLYGDTV